MTVCSPFPPPQSPVMPTPCAWATGLLLAACLACWPQAPALAQTPAPPTTTDVAAEPTPPTTGYAQRADAIRFAAELDQQHGWTDGWAQQWVAQAQHQPTVVQLVSPTPVTMSKNWNAYRQRFIEPKRLQAGADFWREHRRTLQRAETTYGVPAWLIMGILGVETLYGRHTGQYRVLDALTTLAFDFPTSHPKAAQRQAYFRKELQAFLELTHQHPRPVLQWRGSYAGAMGLPQFMPSNWQHLAVDFDGDGRIELLDSPADAIGSVAHYLQHHGWQPGLPTHYPVSVHSQGEDLETLLGPDIVPTFSPDDMQAKGVQLSPAGLKHHGPLALVELKNGDPTLTGHGPTFVAGTSNFYTVTRYNWSSYYAMAVIELGQAVQAQYKRPPPKPRRKRG